jgi:hypothetical protein
VRETVGSEATRPNTAHGAQRADVGQTAEDEGDGQVADRLARVMHSQGFRHRASARRHLCRQVRSFQLQSAFRVQFMLSP